MGEFGNSDVFGLTKSAVKLYRSRWYTKPAIYRSHQWWNGILILNKVFDMREKSQHLYCCNLSYIYVRGFTYRQAHGNHVLWQDAGLHASCGERKINKRVSGVMLLTFPLKIDLLLSETRPAKLLTEYSHFTKNRNVLVTNSLSMMDFVYLLTAWQVLQTHITFKKLLIRKKKGFSVFIVNFITINSLCA